MNFELFTAKQTSLIGVDVSASAIRMVQLNRTKTGFRLDRYAIEKMAEGIITDGAVVKPDELSSALRRCHQSMGLKTKNVAMGLPMESIMIKRLSMPIGLSEEQLEEETRNQMAALMLIDAFDINVDFQIMDATNQEAGAEKEENIEVLAMAARRSKIDERLLPIEDAGLKVVVIDGETIAMNSVVDEVLETKGQGTENKNIAMVHIGHNTSNITVLRNGEAIYTRDAALGVSQLISDIIMRYGISESAAAEMISNASEAPADYEVVTRQYVESATQEIQRAMQLFMTSTSYVNVDAIYLLGEGANVIGLKDGVYQSLNISCAALNPFEGMEISSAAEKGLGENATSLVVACGLALRGFDL